MVTYISKENIYARSKCLHLNKKYVSDQLQLF